MKKLILTPVLVLMLYSCETKSSKTPQPIYNQVAVQNTQEQERIAEEMMRFEPAVHIKAEPQTHSDNLYEYLSDEQIERIEANKKLRKDIEQHAQNQISPTKIQSFPIGESEKDRLEREFKSDAIIAEIRSQILKDSEYERYKPIEIPPSASNPAQYTQEVERRVRNMYPSSNDVYVRSHIRSDGTIVQSHMRTAPNSTTRDNYSTAPNVNPYTGQIGTK